ncbi:hypothetical protein SAMN03080617_04280 [Algoriphagus alkaliphilus]|uniref:Uncharacterized protein n=2 Tax=Algoriphagus alkaliphilus TaxID=279824 RepID=A0A1G5ZQK2_9BACT|nr:hypothetical protein SAMN03080617_04280 [Algoriphagus alkaliphilus]
MNYDVKLINNSEGKGRIELDRMGFLAKHIKGIAQKTLLLQLFGYSKVKMPRNLHRYLDIFLTQTQEGDGDTILTLDAESFKNIPIQLNLFTEKEALKDLTPMALVIKSFTAALSDDADKNMIDEPLLDELLQFKNFFNSDLEKILLSNRKTIPEIEFSKKEIEKVKSLYKSIPLPKKQVVAGVIDEMKYSKEQVILTTSDSKKVIVIVAKDLLSQLKEFFGRDISITGMAHYKPGGNLSYIQLESFGEPGKAGHFLSRRPDQLTTNQQIAIQLSQGKKKNPLDDIFGKWPGNESDEEFEQMMKALD